jgi:tryptophan synthase alpha chain
MIEIGICLSAIHWPMVPLFKLVQQALHNGMTTQVLFDQLKHSENSIHSLNYNGLFQPMLQYGIENFCKKCAEIGIDGLIIPDLPVDVYAEEFKEPSSTD